MDFILSSLDIDNLSTIFLYQSTLPMIYFCFEFEFLVYRKDAIWFLADATKISRDLANNWHTLPLLYGTLWTAKGVSLHFLSFFWFFFNACTRCWPTPGGMDIFFVINPLVHLMSSAASSSFPGLLKTQQFVCHESWVSDLLLICFHLKSKSCVIILRKSFQPDMFTNKNCNNKFHVGKS